MKTCFKACWEINGSENSLNFCSLFCPLLVRKWLLQSTQRGRLVFHLFDSSGHWSLAILYILIDLAWILIKHFWILQAMAEICHNGYVDALRFLQENSEETLSYILLIFMSPEGGGKRFLFYEPQSLAVSNLVLLIAEIKLIWMPITDLISSECPMRSLAIDGPKQACCELARESGEDQESDESTQKNELTPPEDEHWWLDPQLIEKLPVNVKKGEEGHRRAADVINREILLVGGRHFDTNWRNNNIPTRTVNLVQ